MLHFASIIFPRCMLKKVPFSNRSHPRRPRGSQWRWGGVGPSLPVEPTIISVVGLGEGPRSPLPLLSPLSFLDQISVVLRNRDISFHKVREASQASKTGPHLACRKGVSFFIYCVFQASAR